MELTWSFEVERDGDQAYVVERQAGVAGYIKHGPMPRDFAGPFMDERKEMMMAMLDKELERLRSSLAQHSPR